MEETQLVHVTVRNEHVLVKSHRDSNGHVSIVSGGRVTSSNQEKKMKSTGLVTLRHWSSVDAEG